MRGTSQPFGPRLPAAPPPRAVPALTAPCELSCCAPGSAGAITSVASLRPWIDATVDLLAQAAGRDAVAAAARQARQAAAVQPLPRRAFGGGTLFGSKSMSV